MRGLGVRGMRDAGCRGREGQVPRGARTRDTGVRGRADPGKANAPLALWGSLPPSQANGAIWPGRPVADTTPLQGVARLRR